MSCYHPLKAFPVGITASGKTDYKITEYSCQAVCRLRGSGSDGWSAISGNVDLSYMDYYRYEIVSDFVTIPCGQCIGCRIAYSREWANRMLMELPYHDAAFFITLTYDEQHVPYSCIPDLYSGLVLTSQTLDPRDLELFWKRLRKEYCNDSIRYYACGEYGSETWRPHYHAIVFGLHLDDLKVHTVVRGNTYYLSDRLARVWSKGHVLISGVTWQSCAYVARYCTKKAHGRDADMYLAFGLVPEFSRMSKKPGLGYFYFRDHPDLYENLYINISTPDGGKKFRPPRYFDKLFESLDPQRYAEVKCVRREVAEALKEQILFRTDLDMEDYLLVQEELADNAIKKLLRGDI